MRFYRCICTPYRSLAFFYNWYILFFINFLYTHLSSPFLTSDHHSQCQVSVLFPFLILSIPYFFVVGIYIYIYFTDSYNYYLNEIWGVRYLRNEENEDYITINIYFTFTLFTIKNRLLIHLNIPFYTLNLYYIFTII